MPEGTEPAPRRRRGGSKREAAALARIAQLDWRDVDNPNAPLALLSVEQVERIHLASLQVLEEFGVETVGQAAIDLYRAAGAEVELLDSATNGEVTALIKVAPELVMETIAKAPGTFSLTPRNEKRRIKLGGNRINFAMVSGPPNVHDRIGGRRPGNFADYQNFMKLGQQFNCIHLFTNQALAPTDLAPNTRHLDTIRANLTLTDKVFMGQAIGGGRVHDGVEMIALARGLSLDELAADPSFMCNINVNSPRKLDKEMADGAIALAQTGQATVVTPFTLMGAMTTVSLAGALVQQNAEALFGIMLTQLAHAGAPVVYGGFTSNVDLKSGAPAFGTPENARANAIGGQLARRYGLPYRTSACNASNVVDAQAAYETQMALWGGVMGHGNIIYHAAGWMEGGLVASYEKLALDIEMIQNMMEFLAPVNMDEAELGMDAIAETAPGGHFFGAAHTMERYQTAFYQPLLSDWQTNENWALAGEQTATDRATGLWQRALAEYEQPAFPEDRLEAIDAFIAQRKEQIGKGEP